jgi:hypothetical protein
MQSPKLRVGILLDSFEVPAWAAHAMQKVAEGGCTEFALVILNGGTRPAQGSRNRVWLYSIFDRLDRRLFTRTPDPFLPTPIDSLLSGVPEVSLNPVQAADGCSLKEADRQVIRDHALDLVIRIGFEGLQCESQGLAKYGVWYYYFGDDTRMSGGPAGFWEVVENRPETGSALLAAGGRQYPRRVLYRSYFVTYPFSPARHRSSYYWAASAFLPRQIEALYRLGETRFWQETERFNTPPSAGIAKYEVPTGLRAAFPISRIAVRFMSEVFRRRFHYDHWFLLFSLKGGISPDGIRNSVKLAPPRDRFWADPHVVQRNGKYYIFVEELLHSSGRGHISVIELDASGSWKPPIRILEKRYHLSYPSVFEADDRLYMVPESGANETIDLYECTSFPDQWEFRQTLMKNVRAVDTTLWQHAGKWWMFTAIAENAAAAPNVELFLFHSDRLLDGQWIPHPRNPVVSDIKRARPAGGLFMQDGKLIRPSQDCSETYGHAIHFNEVEVLSETDYCERTLSTINPDWDRKVLATHTYATCGNLAVIDAFTYIPRLG